MHRISHCLQSVSRVVVGFLMAVLSINVLIQIACRQVFKISVPWTDEIARFSFIWMALIASSLMVRKRGHFTVTIVADFIRWKRALTVLIDLIIILVALCLFYYGYRYTILGLKKYSSVVHMQMAWVYAAIPAGSLMMIFYGVEMMLETFGLIAPAPVEEEEGEE